ncbi:Pr6Pr family membrane protein [Microbacteriaceae bacterium VKM Ac-2855]|nr:Pr6Pr family membrane protein [Microbacteriaceae bacterium VKM Ac-2855]
MRILFVVTRAAIALAILAAIVGQLIVSLDFWRSRGVENIASNVTNFFSFFTIEANILSMVALLIGAGFLLANRGDPLWFQVTRASVVTYMVTTGVVYNLLLRGIELPQGSTVGWSNEILHVVAPLYLLLDWLFAPGRKPLSFRTVWIVIVFPIVWAVYTLVRGPLVDDQVYGNDYWYPYPFLNPNIAPTGYFSVAFYIVLISAIISLAGLGVVWVSRRRAVAKA